MIEAFLFEVFLPIALMTTITALVVGLIGAVISVFRT